MFFTQFGVQCCITLFHLNLNITNYYYYNFSAILYYDGSLIHMPEQTVTLLMILCPFNSFLYLSSNYEKKQMAKIRK